MSRGATARLFVAVEPPFEVREQLAEWARDAVASLRAAGGRYEALRPLSEHSLHLTLCFLGARPVAEIDVLAASIAGCAEHVCELSVGAPLLLPERRPRALAVEIREHAGELARMHASVTEALRGVSGWEPERRRFRAHITLVRMRAAAIGGHGDECLFPATPRLRFRPVAVVLYRSWLTPQGAGYEELARSELAPVAC